MVAMHADIAVRRPDLEPAMKTLADTHKTRWDTLSREAASLQTKRPRYVVFHDGWQYLEHDIGVDPQAHLISHDELDSGVKRLLDLKKRFAEGAPTCALIEPGMNTALVKKLLPDAHTLTLDPLGWDAPGSDIFSMFHHAYGALADCAGV
jgi:zinc transport system substrate-binding protein